MKLTKINDKVYYIPNVTNIGCILNGDDAILIDTGLEDHTGKKILNILEKEGISVKAIINTHSHADHCGGNAYIKKQTNALIYAPEIEDTIITYPYLEPLYLFSGASPIKELKKKFYMAKQSKVDYIIKHNENYLYINDLKLRIIPLPGHSPNQIGIEVDDVLFCGDTVVGVDILSKHKIPFNMDLNKQRESLNFLKATKYSYYVPSHGSLYEDIEQTVEANINTINEIDESILNIVSKQKTIQEISQDLFNIYGIQINNIGQYCLLNTVIMAHISYLSEIQKIEKFIDNNLIYWIKKN
ncbi:MBL fold metallo-hydrolase [Alkaliphilus sp. MSJ-5]|uniref:MBL fold metallo-hydrolase n=1 Tax=Alkaliphilus flagellatus TaxID=2841507 RepID=A0ABS6G3H6_9FIRM|nr:MBL fold metallo-hydrolase [Alkaliphilus flagellatus]MBU5676923.1 MBL fold metallo-hydrolase [Alkaliphilus flagellatus]